MRQSGFSLLELLVVMVLVALVMGLVGTSLSRSVSGAELRSISRDMLAALRYTRAHAMVTHQQQVLMIDTEQKSYTPPERDTVKLPDEIEMTLTTAASELTADGAAGIRFFPDGGSTGGNIIFHVNEREYRINVAWLTGEASLAREETG